LSFKAASAFLVVPYSLFTSWTPLQAQDAFRSRHIVVTDVPAEPMAFDRQGLETLGSWEALRTIQDLSIPVEDDYSVRQRQGSLADLLTHASMQDGRALNVLDFKIVTSPPPDARIASDAIVWNQTHGMPVFNKDYDYPFREFRWGLAATKGAQHTWHIDADGVATSVQVRTGGKWWVVASPEKGADCYSLGTTDIAQYDPTVGKMGEWIVEAIHLQPGTQL
jgi:hypothetical protein